MSDSEKIRQHGNTFYQKACSTGLSPAVQKHRLEHAMSLYQKAINCANGNHNDMASASKNYAKSACMMAELYRENYKDELDKVIYYSKETFQYFNQAVTFGDTCKSKEWIQDILSSYRISYDDLVETCEELPRKERVTILESAAAGMDNQHYYHDCMLEISNIWLKEAVSALSCKKDFKSSLYALKEMYRPIEILKASGKMRPDILEQALALEEDMVMQMAHTESLQAIHTADSMLQSHLTDSETIDMDYIYTIIDAYRSAIVMTREVELEVEAIAWSNLGKVYDQVLKDKNRSCSCFKLSIELAHALTPRVMTTEPWFKLASTTLQKYQEESVLFQDAKREEVRQKHLGDLKREIKILRDAQDKFKGKDGEFLLHIVQKLPPKRTINIPRTKKAILKLDRTELKKLFQKAVLCYHPDKQDEDTHGKKWAVLCGEITKVFNAIYENYKG